jgi:hypothetical protein
MRLSEALEELGDAIRVNDLDEGLPSAHDATSLSEMAMLNLTGEAGDFDNVFAPAAAPAGYEDLNRDSVRIEVGGERARAASLGDILRSKQKLSGNRTFSGGGCPTPAPERPWE